jgi:hypothetical protein
MSFAGSKIPVKSCKRGSSIKTILRDSVVREDSSTFNCGRNISRLIVALVVLGITSQLWASGWPPFANRDFATVVRGGVVDRLSNGDQSVLDNDFDLEGDKLTAVLDRDVKHGSLDLRPDGTFTYVHNGNNKDSDEFEYRAFDGTRNSRRARVTITIEDTPNSPPVAVGDVPDQNAVEGALFRLELADNFIDPDDGDVLRFSASGLPGSRSLRIDSNTGVLSGTPTGADVRPDPYLVRITATDRDGASASLTFELTIFADDRADMELTISLAANPVTVGETAQWNIDIRNKGPGELDAAQLTANWATSGPALTLTAPGTCAVSGNGSGTPEMNCSISAIPAGDVLTVQVDGTLSADGESSLIGILTADDPVPGNNSDLASSQVVAEFSEGPTQIVNVSGAAVDTGDVNGDGEIDIVAANGQTFIFLNNGNRSVITPGTSLGPGSGGSAVTLLEWNGDTSPDIAVGGLLGSSVEIFVNDGSGGFSSADRLQSDSIGSVADILAADLNNNGRSELIVTGSSGTVIMRGLDQGGFDQLSLSSGAGLDLAVTDVELDGDQDIIVVRQSDRAVDIHYNNGNGSSFDLTRRNYGSVATASSDDLNGDGTPDLLLGVDGDDLNAPKNKVYFQQPDGTFASGGSFGASPVSALLSGDIDGDGWLDVVAVNEAGVHQLYLGSGGSGFALAAEQIVSDGMRRGVLSDFNDDESLDLIMVGRDAKALEIHANNGIGRLGLGDRIAPALELVGESTITHPAGEEFVDPGATAIDDIDGNITEQIEITGVINPTSVGVQSITYEVADRAGNVSSAVRTVNVGVNAGKGGSGGGVLAPAFILLLIVLASIRRGHAAAWRGAHPRAVLRYRSRSS